MPTYRIRWADDEETTVTAATAAEAERVAAARDVLAPGPVCIDEEGGPAWWLAWCPACGGAMRIPAGIDARTGVEIDPRDWAAGELVRACPECGDGPAHIMPAPIRSGTVNCDECEGTGVITRRIEPPSDALDKELETLEAELYRAWLREYEG